MTVSIPANAMPDFDFSDPRLTEHRNPRTVDIDVASSAEIVDMLNAEDRLVAEAVSRARDALAHVIDLVVQAFRDGGSLVYVGAGTSGRLGVLDATECPPTFGSPPSMVRGVIAGGIPALTRSQEGAEDELDVGAAAVDGEGVGTADVVVGIAASGTTPYVRGALRRAGDRGAKTVLVTCADVPPDLAEFCDETIVAQVGPEALTGSTRLKAGTATKLILNTITTGAMVRLGKAYGNLMVDLMAMSEKLRDRGERIVMEAGRVERSVARRAIEEAEGSVKVAVVMVRAGVSAGQARRLLDEAGGRVRGAAGDPPPVVE